MKIVTFKIVRHGPGCLVEWLKDEIQGVEEAWHFVNVAMEDNTDPKAISEVVKAVSNGGIILEVVASAKKIQAEQDKALGRDVKEEFVTLVPAPPEDPIAGEIRTMLDEAVERR